MANRKQQKQIKKRNKRIEKNAINFFSDITPHKFSRNLRNLLLDYLSQNINCLPVDFDATLNNLNSLFALLDSIEDE